MKLKSPIPHQDPEPTVLKRRHPFRQRLARKLPLKTLLLLVAIGAALPFAAPWLSVLWDYDRLRLVLRQLGPWATLIFMGLHIIATVLGIPGVILTMAGGICFGLVWGSIWSLIGATLGAIAAFSLSRYWMHSWFNRKWSHHNLFQSLNRMVSDRPFWFMLTIRFAPISPFNLVNFLLGLTHISIRPYALGTFFGILPGVIIYTWFGRAGYMALHGEDWQPFMLAASVLTLLSAIPLVCRRRTA
ncbi:MAG: TVP38/TMEM64 family protein [Cyanobacteria bacterium P01_F01_bin.42]